MLHCSIFNEGKRPFAHCGIEPANFRCTKETLHLPALERISAPGSLPTFGGDPAFK